MKSGAISQHFTDTGADFDFSRLDYSINGQVWASRYIATIMAGRRTELAYWAMNAPAKSLTVHQGLGRLVIGKPDSTTTAFSLDPEVTPEVILPSGRFYTFEASSATPVPLVISGLYREEVDWGNMEKYLEPGQRSVEAPEGVVEVPEDFRIRYKV